MMTKQHANAAIILADGFFLAESRLIAAQALKHRLPSISQLRELTEAGSLMSYGPNTVDNFRRAATYVDKILKGAKPGDLPFELPSRYHLVINHKTARTLALAIPQTLLVRRTKSSSRGLIERSRSEDEDALAGRLGVEELVSALGFVELEPVRQEFLERYLLVHDEARTLRLAHGAERPRRVDGELAAQHVLTDIEGGGSAALADEGNAAPGAGASHRGHPCLGHARAVHGRLGAFAVRQIVDGLHGIGGLGVDHFVCAELLGEIEPLLGDVHGDHTRAHGVTEHGRGEPHRALTEHGECVSAGYVDALQRAVGGARAAGNGRALLEGELVG